MGKMGEIPSVFRIVCSPLKPVTSNTAIFKILVTPKRNHTPPIHLLPYPLLASPLLR